MGADVIAMLFALLEGWIWDTALVAVRHHKGRLLGKAFWEDWTNMIERILP